MNDLGIFILVYNRDNIIPTLSVLHKHKVFENIYLVVGKDDPKFDTITKSYKNVLVFDKKDFENDIDSIGSYRNTLKICTYARLFVDKYAEEHNIRYVCLLFDDIQSMQLRYVDGNKVKSLRQFDLKPVLNEYLELLNSSQNIYMTGPAGSSFYIGCNVETSKRCATHYANMLIYDTTNKLLPYKASVLEDMTIVLYNSQIGHIGVFPFGLQVNCREPKRQVSDFEYIQQFRIMCQQTFDIERMNIPYSNFLPKIVSDKYKKE